MENYEDIKITKGLEDNRQDNNGYVDAEYDIVELEKEYERLKVLEEEAKSSSIVLAEIISQPMIAIQKDIDSKIINFIDNVNEKFENVNKNIVKTEERINNNIIQVIDKIDEQLKASELQRIEIATQRDLIKQNTDAVLLLTKELVNMNKNHMEKEKVLNTILKQKEEMDLKINNSLEIRKEVEQTIISNINKLSESQERIAKSNETVSKIVVDKVNKLFITIGIVVVSVITYTISTFFGK
jgi:hypothetical protein